MRVKFSKTHRTPMAGDILIHSNGVSAYVLADLEKVVSTLNLENPSKDRDKYIAIVRLSGEGCYSNPVSIPELNDLLKSGVFTIFPAADFELHLEKRIGN